MKTYKEAYEYTINTTPEDIAKRFAIYSMWIQIRYNTNLGHDYLLTMVIALLGAFPKDMMTAFNEPKIIDLMKNINWGFDPKWATKFGQWAQENAINMTEMTYFAKMFSLVAKEGKGDLVNNEFQRILQHQPTEYEYFPELNPYYLFDQNVNRWPRI
jgi:hypothetical protein